MRKVDIRNSGSPVPYREESVESRFLSGDLEAVSTVIRWISVVLTSPRFWALRGDWLDLHQEVMERVVESLRVERFDPSQDFRTYVQGVARYTALQALTSRLRTPAAQALNGPAPQSASAAEEAIDSRQLVRRVLGLASDGCRGLLLAYFYEQRSYLQIAEALAVPVGTVKSRLARCLKRAHEVLQDSRPRRGIRPQD